MIPKHIN